MNRTGQTWLNDDQPTSWSLVLVVGSHESDTPGFWCHSVLILDCGSESGYRLGKRDVWTEDIKEDLSWDADYGVMRRIT